MTGLAAQQQCFLQALFDWPADVAEGRLIEQLAPGALRGIRAYQTNGHVLARRRTRSLRSCLVARDLTVWRGLCGMHRRLCRVTWRDGEQPCQISCVSVHN